jgi:hypothetical protein
MSTQGAGGMQVEKVLDDLITRLSSRSGPEARAALIEARRLRNVTTRWAAIPPPPDARREMLSRVMDLVSKAGGPQPEPSTLESERTPEPTRRAPDRTKKPDTRGNFDELPPLDKRGRQGASKSSPAATRMGYDSFTDPGPTPRSPIEIQPDSAPPDSLGAPRSSRRISPHRGPTIAGIPEAFGLKGKQAPSQPAARATPSDSLGPEHETRRPTPHRGPTISGIPRPRRLARSAALRYRPCRRHPRVRSAPRTSPSRSSRTPAQRDSGRSRRLHRGANAAESFRRETLMMGADAKAQVQSLVDEILGEKAQPGPASETPSTARPGGGGEPEVSSERDAIPAVLGNPSSRRHTNPLGAALDDAPSSKRGAEQHPATMAPGSRSSTPIDGSAPRCRARASRCSLSQVRSRPANAPPHPRRPSSRRCLRLGPKESVDPRTRPRRSSRRRRPQPQRSRSVRAHPHGPSSLRYLRARPRVPARPHPPPIAPRARCSRPV